MSKTFREWHVEQSWLFPPSIRDLVPEGHLAHFVRESVRDSLDLSAILESYREERGYPPYHPALMTAVLLYAYCRGIYSSRRIAQACEERVDFMAITARQTPDFRTIAEFRRRHLKALGALFEQALALCQKAGLVRLGHVALDGTKIRANASKHKAMSYGRMNSAQAALEAEVTQWLKKAEAADVREDEELGGDRRGDELPQWVVSKQARLEKIREAKAALEREARERAAKEDDHSKGAGGGARSSALPEEKSQRNFTDPESRILKTSSGFEQAYNAQAAVDGAHQVIVACDLNAEQNDAPRLIPLLAALHSNTQRNPTELSADTGYFSEENLRALKRRGIRGYIASGRLAHGESLTRFARGTLKGPLSIAMQQRLRRAGRRSRYRLRKTIVEPVFGQIKGARGFRQFLLRGLAKVREEWRLICTAHNLLKLAAASL